MKKLLTWTTGFVIAASSIVPAQPTDTTKISTEPLFTARDAWVAAGFVAGTVALYPADRYFARKLQSPGNQENRFLGDAASGLRFMGTPGSMIIGLPRRPRPRPTGLCRRRSRTYSSMHRPLRSA